MLGAIAGDFVGSRHEFNPIKDMDFQLLHPGCVMTDDSIMTVAVAEALLDADGSPTRENFRDSMVHWGRACPDAGYGLHFLQWIMEGGLTPYGSAGNGSCMRVSPVAWFARDLADTERLARLSAIPSHDHVDGIRGAVAVAVATRMALEGWEESYVEHHVERLYGYELSGYTVEQIRPRYTFHVLARNSAPPALRCALEGRTWEEGVRMAVSLGGDADTMAAIAGGVREGFAHARGDKVGMVPAAVEAALRAHAMVSGQSRTMKVLDAFQTRFAGAVFKKSDIGALARNHPDDDFE